MKQAFVSRYLPAAVQAAGRFKMNPAILLAQAAIESGWGESHLCRTCNNFFGITGYGAPNVYWNGDKTPLSDEGGASHLQFRVYATSDDSFMDFARLIRAAYPLAASLSYHPRAYAKEIAYSRYISEVNGDNRAAYCSMLVSIERHLQAFMPLPAPAVADPASSAAPAVASPAAADLAAAPANPAPNYPSTQ